MRHGKTKIRLGSVSALYRYPVKGLSAEPLPEVDLDVADAIPFDRAYAIENGPGRFDPFQPRPVPKINFLTLMREDKLAKFTTQFDPATETLVILREGQPIAQGRLTTPSGRAILSQFFAEFLKGDLRGAPRIVSAKGHVFADKAEKCLHIVNRASLSELERSLNHRLDVVRFRPNLVIDEARPWSELTWVGRTLEIGGTEIEVFERTTRCAAVNVDPATGTRDIDIPAALMRQFGHADFGVYARIISKGHVCAGDDVALVE